MYKYRDSIPINSTGLFLTDGGLETTLVFHHHLDLPEFAAFTLLDQANGIETLRNYYLPYIRTAREQGAGFILESPTWRASRAWARKIGYDVDQLESVNASAISMLADLRREFEMPGAPMVISGCIGPYGDGYQVSEKLTVSEAEEYHREQIDILSRTEADLVSAFTINYNEEAEGIVLATKASNMPVVISFTTETDGRLPSGKTLKDAVQELDDHTGAYPVYYMINCAHPVHFNGALKSGEPWVRRIRAIRANASEKSHEELDASTELDEGNSQALGQWYRALKDRLPDLSVFGGCCGTDVSHIREIARAIH
ncbi:homocysteine S-methyltransferase family protein [Desulfospira joergensenii]|uniref:homocysteine S-methyltransferase family protein n=1 Tax=Desulfospira joergensenii TaxID=53329 RepID=UPI0003B6F04C|nr:homocysteine S-methyltransferase family protein [Desulfospira joergensenii]